MKKKLIILVIISQIAILLLGLVFVNNLSKFNAFKYSDTIFWNFPPENAFSITNGGLALYYPELYEFINRENSSISEKDTKQYGFRTSFTFFEKEMLGKENTIGSFSFDIKLDIDNARSRIIKDAQMPLLMAGATFELIKRYNNNNQSYITIHVTSDQNNSEYLFVNQPCEIHYSTLSKSINLYCKKTVCVGRISANSNGVEILIPYTSPPFIYEKSIQYIP